MGRRRGGGVGLSLAGCGTGRGERLVWWRGGGGGVVVGTSGRLGPSVRSSVWSGVCRAGVIVVRWRVGSPHADVRPHFPVVLAAAGVAFVVVGVWRVGSPHADFLPHFPPVVAPVRCSVWWRRVSSNGAPGSRMARFRVPKAFHWSAGFWNVTFLIPAGGSNLARIVGGTGWGRPLVGRRGLVVFGLLPVVLCCSSAAGGA